MLGKDKMIPFLMLNGAIKNSMKKLNNKKKREMKKVRSLAAAEQDSGQQMNKGGLALLIFILVLYLILIILWLKAWIIIARCAKKWDRTMLLIAVILQLIAGPIGSIIIIYSLKCAK